MQIQVRFFATLRDRAGTASTNLDLPDGATVKAMLEALSARYSSLRGAVDTALVAVNEEYAFPEDTLSEGDAVALFPPVSGGSHAEWPEYFAVTNDRLDLDEISARITGPQTGALAIFSGVVRGITHEAGAQSGTDYLFYEAYVPMAEKTLRQVAQEIRAQYPKVQGIAIVQRIGRLEVGETTILVACSSGHRHDGIFEAARYGIDRVKEIVPVWKKEFGPDGSFWVEGHYHPTLADRDGAPVGRDNGDTGFAVGCPSCGMRYPLDTRHYVCQCGHPLEVVQAPKFDAARIDRTISSMWRYAAFLSPRDLGPITLGEGWTPLIRVSLGDRIVNLKLEGLNPTGSFKDRGASLLVSLLKAHGITAVHDDSSGNAGAALAAYAARAGIRARLFVPDYASPVKLAQIELYNADLERVGGPRTNASIAAQRAAVAGDSFYASHIHQPMAVWGFTSLAYELWEQLDQRAPDAVIVPLGQGAQLLGLAWGFGQLKAAGAIDTLPRLYGVQSVQCAPLWQALHGEQGYPAEGETIAEGIRISRPVRAESVLSAVRESGGDILAVEESSIVEALLDLAEHGVSAEPTSAVVWAVLPQISQRLPQSATIVLSISGSGLKTPHVKDLLRQRVSKVH